MSIFDTSRFVQEIYPLSTEAEEPELRCQIVGYLKSLGGFHWAQTIDSGIILSYILEGKGILHKNGRTYPFEEGMTGFSAAGDKIEYFDTPGHPWRYIWLHIDGAKTSRIWKHLTSGEDLPPHRLDQGEELLSLLKDALRKAKSNNYGCYYSVSLAWSLLDLLGVEMKGTEGATDISLAETCAAYINGHLSNAPTVDELAERFKVSRVTVFRAFKEKFGISPKGFIEDMRFRKATKLLADLRLEVKEIAFQCGFKDQSHFSCQFKRKFGASPGQWRAKR